MTARIVNMRDPSIFTDGRTSAPTSRAQSTLLDKIESKTAVVGIPFGVQHLKLAGIALAPIGKTIVTKEVAAAARRANAEAAITMSRGTT